MPPDFLPIESNNKDTEQVSSNLKKSAVDMEILNLIGRSERLFDQDIQDFAVELKACFRMKLALVWPSGEALELGSVAIDRSWRW